MSLLILLRCQFTGFPFHPIGFVFPFTYLTRPAFTSFLIAWLAKLLILGIGGIGLYRRTQPLFLGLAVSYAFGVGLSYVVDWVCSPSSAHIIHSW